jgi:hypothetical protein
MVPEGSNMRIFTYIVNFTFIIQISVGGGPPGYDFRNNVEIDTQANGTYSSVS